MGKPISEYTIEELQSKAKTFKSFLVLICVFAFLAAGSMVYLKATGAKFNPAMIAVFVAIFGGAVPSMSGLASIKKEIATRTEN